MSDILLLNVCLGLRGEHVGTYMGASLHISLSIWEGNTLQNVILEVGSPAKSLWNLISLGEKKELQGQNTIC